MNRIFNIFLLSAALSVSTGAFAQYDQNVNVEGYYVPEFIPKDRIGKFPVPARPSLDPSSLSFFTDDVIADFKPQAIQIPATAWRDSRSIESTRGYLDLGLGLWLESALSAGYRFVDNPGSDFGIRLQHNSSSLWKPKLSAAVRDNHMQRYDESMAIYGHHDFDGYGRLEAAADYHLGYFNYYGFNPVDVPMNSTAGNIEAPTQTLNDAAVRLAWFSQSAPDSFRWNIGLAARYFGLRRLYIPSEDSDPLRSFTGGRETRIALDAGFNFPFSKKSSAGADLDADMLIYADYDSRGSANQAVTLDAPGNYGNISIKPYYCFAVRDVKLHIGTRIDLAMNAREPHKRYRTFNIAPDVRLDYNAGPASIFLYAVGGNELNTLASTWQKDYYMVPAIFSTTPAYSPVDAKVGFSFGPFSGFKAGFGLSYKVTFNQRLYGWYQPLLNGLDVMSADIAGDADCRFISGYTLRGFSASLNAGYDAGRWFKIDATGTYQPQNGGKGYFNGIDRPRWTATASAETNPWNSLKFKLGMDFRAVRAFYSGETMYRVPHWVSLNFGAAYNITDNFGLWLQADNLTDHKNILAPGLPVPGISLTGGISLEF